MFQGYLGQDFGVLSIQRVIASLLLIFKVLSRIWGVDDMYVVDGFWIDDQIYCTLKTTCYYTSQTTPSSSTADSRDSLNSISKLPEILVILPWG
jgi:hypothetical protein